MRKVLLSVIACCAVVAVVPAAALARGDRHERHHHHHHRGHHARIRHREFGGDHSAVSSQGENAGTVQSFTGGVLTIALGNGQTVSGQVTPGTEIECQAAETSSLRSHDRGGEDNRGDDNGDNNDQGDDRGQGEVDNDNDDQMCTSADLTQGAVVHEAELRISSLGSVWDKVDLVSASAANNDNDNDDD